MKVIERILVYIDGSEQSITAAQYAICLSRMTGASLAVLYVVNTRALDDLVKAKIFLKEEHEEYARDLESDARRYLNMVKRMASEKGLEISAISRKGSVHQEVSSIVKELGIDLLVLGELPKIHSRRDELFDEAERAMRLSACSVLIVKDYDRTEDLFESLE